jgi:hypothetical protein
MKSRVHPNYKTKYRVKNWASYDRALVRRGDLTVWLSAEAIATWKPAGVGKRGGQLKYSDISIADHGSGETLPRSYSWTNAIMNYYFRRAA